MSAFTRCVLYTVSYAPLRRHWRFCAQHMFSFSLRDMFFLKKVLQIIANRTRSPFFFQKTLSLPSFPSSHGSSSRLHLLPDPLRRWAAILPRRCSRGRILGRRRRQGWGGGLFYSWVLLVFFQLKKPKISTNQPLVIFHLPPRLSPTAAASCSPPPPAHLLPSPAARLPR